MVATDVEGNEVDGKVPDVFYLGDKGGEDKLVATHFLMHLLQKLQLLELQVRQDYLNPLSHLTLMET